MHRFILFFFVFCTLPDLNSQNLVPNPSFEELRDLPVKDNPKRSFTYEPISGYIPYQQNLNYWFAATSTSPDLRIHNQVKYNECRRLFKNCDKAHSGQNCVGIITYMGNIKTDTYREYIQVKLKTNLRPNVMTYVEFWIEKEREAKLVSNNIGCHFSMKKTTVNTMETLNLIPQINIDTLINAKKKQWTKVEFTFIPEEPYKFLLIGNFYRNEKTLVKEFSAYNASPYIPSYAYYLIDDVRIWQEGDPEENIPLVYEDNEVKPNVPIALKHIEFDHDSAVLKSSSIEDLEKLLGFLKSYPKIKIAIHGHTDSTGEDNYNLTLSNDRAQSVVEYLLSKGIAEERLETKGFGEKKPIAENESNEGKQRNRRVTFSVIEN